MATPDWLSNLIPGRTGTTIKKINLALQGGGAHGAFTWGVLDHLLSDGRLAIEGISGASAGAMNAIMLADGLARGGPEEAQKRLAEFWRAASLGGNLPPLQRAVVDRMLSFLPIEGVPMLAWLDALSQLYSPYDVNPLNINPLVRHSVPMSAQEIMNRVNEITFNSSLLDEFRAIEFVARLIDQRRLPRGKGPGQYRRINVHRVVLDSEGKAFTAASKLSNDYEFFEMLRENGRRAARRFLDEHFDDIGVKSTVDLRSEVPAVVE